MPLKTVLESLDGLDEAVQNLYTKTENGYILNVEGVDAHPDVANLKSAYERVKADKKTISDERDALKTKVDGLPSDFDPDQWEKFKKGGAPDPEEMVKMRQTLESERDEWRQKYEGTIAEIQKRSVRDAVTAALADHGVPEAARYGAGLHMLDGRKVEMQGDTPMIDTDMGPMAVADYAKRWVASEGKGYVQPPQGGGAKGNPGNGTGTVTKEQFTQMGDRERIELFKSDPDTFRQLSGG